MAGDSYLWVGPVAGSWDVAGNWDDVTTGMNPAAVAPGVNDAVTINQAAAGATQVITGTGNSASLTINGATLLDGQFSTGALTVVNTSLFLQAGNSLAVSGNVTANGIGKISLTDATLTDTGVFTLNGTSNTGTLTLSNGSSVRVGGLTLYSGVTVDATSSMEVGAVGGVAAGSFQVDAGATLNGSSGNGSTIYAPNVLNNGTISSSTGSNISISFSNLQNNGLITNFSLVGVIVNAGT